MEEKIRLYDNGYINEEGERVAKHVTEFLIELYSKYDESDLSWIVTSIVEMELTK